MIQKNILKMKHVSIGIQDIHFVYVETYSTIYLMMLWFLL